MGEWVQIQLPSAVSLTSYSLQARSDYYNQSPSAWYIAGSNDGITWYQVDNQSGQASWSGGLVIYYSVSAASSYTYYRIVVTNNMSSNSVCCIGEWRLYGYPS